MLDEDNQEIYGIEEVEIDDRIKSKLKKEIRKENNNGKRKVRKVRRFKMD